MTEAEKAHADMDDAMSKIKRLKAELIEAELEWREARDRLVLAEQSAMISQSP